MYGIREYVYVYTYVHDHKIHVVEMATKNDIVKAIDTACLEVKVVLKAQQRQSIEAALEGKDVFVTLPTGYGKSMIFHLLPLCSPSTAIKSSPCYCRGTSSVVSGRPSC